MIPLHTPGVLGRLLGGAFAVPGPSAMAMLAEADGPGEKHVDNADLLRSSTAITQPGRDWQVSMNAEFS